MGDFLGQVCLVGGTLELAQQPFTAIFGSATAPAPDKAMRIRDTSIVRILKS
jgi:hypothetical protein